jgi:hypothetical protein
MLFSLKSTCNAPKARAQKTQPDQDAKLGYKAKPYSKQLTSGN